MPTLVGISGQNVLDGGGNRNVNDWGVAVHLTQSVGQNIGVSAGTDVSLLPGEWGGGRLPSGQERPH